MIELHGDHIRIEQSSDGTTITFDDKGTGRICGSCQLCCKLVPVPDIHKAAGVRCEHSKAGKGCAIYATRPFACRTWSCRWLSDRETAGMPRPDRCHYVIDLALDQVRMEPHDGSAATTFDVVQVWVDPAFPQARHAPELRAYMLMMAERHHIATIVRFDSERAVVIFPPPFDPAGQWHEVTDSNVLARNEMERRVLADFQAAKKDR